MDRQLTRRLRGLVLATAIGVLAAALALWARLGDPAPGGGLVLVKHFDARQARMQTGTGDALSAPAPLPPRAVPGGAAESPQIPLPFRWDASFAHLPGRVDIAIGPDQLPGCGAMGLLFTRLGNQTRLVFNGRTVLERGTLGEPGYDAAKAPQFVALPPELTDCRQGNRLQIQASFQPQRGGRVSEFLWGPQAQVRTAYERQYLWRVTAQTVYCIGFALIGSMALALWLRLRDPVFAAMAAAGLLGVVRNLDRIWPAVPVPWPAWGAMVNTAYAWHLALMFLFAMLVLDLHLPRLRRLLLAYLPLSAALVLLGTWLQVPTVWSLTLALLLPLGLAVWYAVARRATLSGQAHATACVLAGVGGLALPAGVHDLVCVNAGFSLPNGPGSPGGWAAGAGLGCGGSSSFSLTSLAMFLFALMLCGVIVDRYVRITRELRFANATLDARIRAREQELEHSHALLRAEREALAATNERQRIMRDLHDGVGAQLVGLQSLLREPQHRVELLREHVEAALDEMRLAVDSMQLGDGDLTTALATLRYRVLPRLQAAGLALHWTVDEVSHIAALTPHVALQVQRILLEALTNVLKHARARNVWVECSVATSPLRLRLDVVDDGIGPPAAHAPAAGHGLKNMRARASSIQARLELQARPGGGTRVTLLWPAGDGTQAQGPSA